MSVEVHDYRVLLRRVDALEVKVTRLLTETPWATPDKPQPAPAPVTVAEVDAVLAQCRPNSNCNRCDMRSVLARLRSLVAEADAKARIVAAGYEWDNTPFAPTGKKWHIWRAGTYPVEECYHSAYIHCCVGWAEEKARQRTEAQEKAGEWSEPVSSMTRERACDVAVEIGGRQ